MNRNQLAEQVNARTNLDRGDVDRVVTAVLDTLVDAVAAGDTVTLPGFGTFDRRARAARTGRHPQTGEPMEIPATQAPGFKAAQGFRRRVSEG